MSTTLFRPESRRVALHGPVAARNTVPLLAGLVVVGASLRLWWSISYPFSYDESFTAMAGRRSFWSIPGYLRVSDAHPPLDYLLRAPLSQFGVSDVAFRAPSVLLSIGALALFAWWMHDRGRVGVIATGLLAVSPFQIGYGSEARMYATLQVVGVAAALLTERWLRRPARWHAPLVSLAIAVALFDHVSAFLLVPGVFVVAGFRGDRDAWRWRAWMLGAIAVWAVGWGWAFERQRTASGVNRIPPTTVARFLDAISNSVTFTNGVVLVVVLAVGAGAVLLYQDDRVLGRVWLGLGLVPYVVGAILGLFVHFFMDRTFSVAAWAPVLAVAWLADRAMRRSVVTRAVAAVALVLLVVPGTFAFLGGTWGYGVSADAVAAQARPGDVVAIVPQWYGHLIDWEIGVHGPAGSRPTPVQSIANAAAVVVGGHRTGHRTWLVTLASNLDRYEEFSRCAPDQVHGSERLLCLVTPE